MTYAQPDLSRTSTNIGDFVQTLGSLSHVVRHSGARFDDSELGRFAAGLAGRVPGSLRVESPEERRVRLFEVDRDASHLAEIPDGTWLLGFGWYAHTVGGVRHHFPFDPRVRPLFVSFHVSRRSMLTEEAIDHLRRHAPIGCRDWSTVDLLLSLDIPAFFSGCLTTTVRYIQPDDQPSPGPDAPVVYVDVEPPRSRDDGLPVGPRVLNERPEVALRPAGENLRDALDILDGYATDAGSAGHEASPLLSAGAGARQAGGVRAGQPGRHPVQRPRSAVRRGGPRDGSGPRGPAGADLHPRSSPAPTRPPSAPPGPR